MKGFTNNRTLIAFGLALFVVIALWFAVPLTAFEFFNSQVLGGFDPDTLDWKTTDELIPGDWVVLEITIDKNIDEVLNTNTGITLYKPEGDTVDIFFSIGTTAGNSTPVECYAMVGGEKGELVWQVDEHEELNENLTSILIDIWTLSGNTNEGYEGVYGYGYLNPDRDVFGYGYNYSAEWYEIGYGYGYEPDEIFISCIFFLGPGDTDETGTYEYSVIINGYELPGAPHGEFTLGEDDDETPPSSYVGGRGGAPVGQRVIPTEEEEEELELPETEVPEERVPEVPPTPGEPTTEEPAPVVTPPTSEPTPEEPAPEEDMAPVTILIVVVILAGVVYWWLGSKGGKGLMKKRK